MSETGIAALVAHSSTLGALAEALAKAQGQFGSVVKDQTAKIESAKGGYSYRYADLASVLEAIRKPLSGQGLALVQPICWNDGHPWLVTRLLHVSGEWIESLYPLASYDRPQEMGSAITYARRYTLTALLGIAAEEDDDGQAAEKSARTARTQAATATEKRGQAPKCPTCDSTKGVMQSKFGGLPWYCKDCKKAFADPKEVFADEPMEEAPF